MRSRLRRLRHRGDAVTCPCCGGRFDGFLPSAGRPGVACPGCGARERHRAIAPRLRTAIEPGMRVLHFAPEWWITNILLEADIDDILGHNAIGTPSSVIASRELWARAGGFDEWLDVLAPWDLWIRWSRAGTARMSATPTVAARAGALLSPSANGELRELKRRYGGDAKRAGVHFGTLPPIVAAPSDGARPPWLVEQPGTTREPPRPTV